MKSIVTIYKGKEYRSRLEADMAWVIHRIGHEYEYEPHSFLLPVSGVHYLPDFYVRRLGLWIEARGYETAKGEMQIREFAAGVMRGDLKGEPDYMVVRYASEEFYEAGANDRENVALAQCGVCGGYFFLGNNGSYRCRCGCGAADGDGHLVVLKYFDGIEKLKLEVGTV